MKAVQHIWGKLGDDLIDDKNCSKGWGPILRLEVSNAMKTKEWRRVFMIFHEALEVIVFVFI